MATFNVTDETFDEQVIRSSIPVVIDFWAEWCGPCKQIGPALEELSEEYGEKIKIAKINVDENTEISKQHEIRGIPCFIYFEDGEPIKKQVGMQTIEQLKELTKH